MPATIGKPTRLKSTDAGAEKATDLTTPESERPPPLPFPGNETRGENEGTWGCPPAAPTTRIRRTARANRQAPSAIGRGCSKRRQRLKEVQTPSGRQVVAVVGGPLHVCGE